MIKGPIIDEERGILFSYFAKRSARPMSEIYGRGLRMKFRPWAVGLLRALACALRGHDMVSQIWSDKDDYRNHEIHVGCTRCPKFYTKPGNAVGLKAMAEAIHDR